MAEYKQVECSRCKGNGECDLCEGTGRVYPYKIEYAERGAQMRADRIAAGRTLDQQAKRRGIDAVDLSRMERGVTPPIRGDSKICFGTRLTIRIKKDWDRHKREGFVLAQAEFDEWEYEIDGRHTTHGPWYGWSPLVGIIGVRILDEDGNQRRWPKVRAPWPCPQCHGHGYSPFAVDGSRTSESKPCDVCDGHGWCVEGRAYQPSEWERRAEDGTAGR